MKRLIECITILLVTSNPVLIEGRKNDPNDESSEKQTLPVHKCGIYLAESSIPNSGFGIYTTRSIKSNQNIQSYPDAPSIVVTDFYEPSKNEEGDWNHVDYIWEGMGKSFYEADEISESVMTFGSLTNFHTVSLLYIYIQVVFMYCVV
jgi:hypothetical protein